MHFLCLLCEGMRGSFPKILCFAYMNSRLYFIDPNAVELTDLDHRQSKIWIKDIPEMRGVYGLM